MRKMNIEPEVNKISNKQYINATDREQYREYKQQLWIRLFFHFISSGR